MNCFAYYRLPYDHQFTCVESDGKPLILDSIERIGEKSGFVIAPFVASAQHPIVLIRPDRVAVERCKPMQGAGCCGAASDGHVPISPEYAEAFERFHGAVCSGEFQKLVLSRKVVMSMEAKDCKQLFLKACAMYPRLMIMLFHTEETGTWLVASPEILVDGKHKSYHTIALAGTMPYKEGYAEWSNKNMAEQQVVERYIESTIAPMCVQVTKDGPVTSRAGNLVHLRTDFRFSLSDHCTLGQFVAKLHPTPAVCGLPKREAMRFVLNNEGMDRTYYSGFAGPVGVNDETHLYVLLRCAAIGEGVTLYAGGGIMPDSVAEQEWIETEKKMETIGNVFK